MLKVVLLVGAILIVLLGFVGVNQFTTVTKAHSTFENYYAFRGCIKLLQKTDTFATCKLVSGQTIKMVKYQGKWYLDGDLPVCYFNYCL